MAIIELSEIKTGVSNLKLITHIFDERRDLSPKAKLIALASIKHRNITTLACHPSYKRLKEITGYSRDTIVRGVRELEDKRVLIIERNHRGPRGRAVNHYLFLYDAAEAYSAWQEDRMNTDLAPGEERMLISLFIKGG